MISIITIFIIELLDAITLLFHFSMMTLPHHSSTIRELFTSVIIKTLQTAVKLATIVANILLDAIAPAPFVKAGWVDHNFFFFLRADDLLSTIFHPFHSLLHVLSNWIRYNFTLSTFSVTTPFLDSSLDRPRCFPRRPLEFPNNTPTPSPVSILISRVSHNTPHATLFDNRASLGSLIGTLRSKYYITFF